MQHQPAESRIILVGGGHSHCIFLKKWAMRKKRPPLDIILVNPEAFTPYTGMLPGLISGYYKKEEVYVDLLKLCNASGTRLLIGKAENINLIKKTLLIKDRPEIHFDFISMDVGIKSAPLDFPNLSGQVVSAKPLNQLYSNWIDFLSKSKKLKCRKITIIGGGLGGVEIAFSVNERLRKEATPFEITIINKGLLLNNENSKLKHRLRKLLLNSSIKFEESVNILASNKKGIHLSNGTFLESDFTILASGAHPYPWIEQSGVPCRNGFIIVDRYLKSPKFPFLYASGDCAHLIESPRPKSGVFAVRSGPYLYHNLIAAIERKKPKAFKPQKNHLKLVSIGRKKALSSGRGFHFLGAIVWRWKNRIDQSFMNSFFKLRPMNSNYSNEKWNSNNNDQMLCGGCGSKISQNMLMSQIGKIKIKKAKNVLNEIGDDAAIVKTGTIKQIITTDHLREFTKDPWLMSRISILHSLGDIWAMGAVPNYALLNIIIPEASKSIQSSWLREIMGAAEYTFYKENISLIGGHTTQGSELTIGVTIVGEVTRKPKEINKAKVGDKIILTKPLGTGVILAGEMRGLTSGQDFLNSLSWMQRSQRLVTEFSTDINAMTDVTGFGLAGHLMNICKASLVSARVSMKKVPLMNGAAELTKKGIRSTLFPDNRNQKEIINLSNSPAFDLLFDPQTSGGMLMSAPRENVKRLQTELMRAGLSNSVIGEFKEGRPNITVTD